MFRSAPRHRHLRYRLAAMFVTAVFVLAGCGGSSSSGDADSGDLASMEPVELRIALQSTAQSSSAKAVKSFTDVVTERSGGKITFEVFTGSSLLTLSDALGGLSSGVADMGTVSMSFFPQQLPIANWMLNLASVPAPFPLGIMEGTGATMEVVSSNEAIQKEFADNGIHLLLQYMSFMPSDLLCTSPVTTPAEMAGKRVRTPSQVAAREVEALGAVPVQLGSTTEFYEAMQRGVIDCNYLFPTTYADLSLWEVGKYYIPVQFTGQNATAYIMSKQTWERLPLEAQQLIHDALPVLAQAIVENELPGYARFAAEGPQQHGIEFLDPRQLDRVIQEHQRRSLANLAATAPASLPNAQAVVDQFVAATEEWHTQLLQTLGVTDVERTPEAIRQSYIDAPKLDVSRYGELIKTKIFDPMRPS